MPSEMGGEKEKKKGEESWGPLSSAGRGGRKGKEKFTCPSPMGGQKRCLSPCRDGKKRGKKKGGRHEEVNWTTGAGTDGRPPEKREG